MEDYTDLELMNLVKQKHRPALEEIYTRYIKLIYSFVYKFSNGNEEVAKEMVQMTFLKLWTTKSTYDHSKGKFVNWLLTLVRNVCIDYIRKEQKHTHWYHHYEADRTADLADPSNPMEEVFQKSEIAEAKSRLSAEQRKLIDLLYWRGFTLKEIAELENTPAGTIKSRLHQSLKQLRKQLKNGGFIDGKGM